MQQVVKAMPSEGAVIELGMDDLDQVSGGISTDVAYDTSLSASIALAVAAAVVTGPALAAAFAGASIVASGTAIYHALSDDENSASN